MRRQRASLWRENAAPTTLNAAPATPAAGGRNSRLLESWIAERFDSMDRADSSIPAMRTAWDRRSLVHPAKSRASARIEC